MPFSPRGSEDRGIPLRTPLSQHVPSREGGPRREGDKKSGDIIGLRFGKVGKVGRSSDSGCQSAPEPSLSPFSPSPLMMLEIIWQLPASHLTPSHNPPSTFFFLGGGCSCGRMLGCRIPACDTYMSHEPHIHRPYRKCGLKRTLATPSPRTDSSGSVRHADKTHRKNLSTAGYVLSSSCTGETTLRERGPLEALETTYMPVPVNSNL